ncbi:MAG: serine hydrolase domain-containing protein [Burkholderiaceae bacterium]
MAAAGFDPRGLTRLRGAFVDRVDAGRIPGAVWLLGGDAVPDRVDCVGWQDAARTSALREDAIFRIHSMTKPIVSVAALALYEQGRLSLADPVARHLPEFADVRVGVDGSVPQRPMTLHDLLRHTAGLTYEFLPPDPVRQRYVDADLFSRQRSTAEFATRLAGLPLICSPGARWEYSRATDLLGRALEVIAGESLGIVLQKIVFDPLGMTDTGFFVSAERAGRVAQAFATDPDTGAAVKLFDPLEEPRFESAGGGLVSTVRDYGRFVRCLAGGGSLDGVRLLGRKTVDWMASDHLGAISHDGTILPPGYGFGLGVAVRTAAGLATDPGSVGSYGWSGAAGSIFVVDPTERVYALLMVQAPGQMAELWDLFRSLVYAALD